MRHPANILTVRFLGQAAAVALLAGSAAGCSSDVTRFGDMFGPTDNQSQIITGSVNPAPQPAPQPLPAYQSPAVAAQPLPAPPGAVATNAPYVRPAGQPMAPLPTPAAPAAVATATPPPAVPGWSATGGTTVTVNPGDSVAVLARRYGVPEQAILASNGLAKGSALTPGRTVVIPAYSYGAKTAAAPAVAPGQPTAPATRAASIYEVKPGDSLGRIANDNGMKSTELAAYNGIDATQPIRIGQKLKIPAAGAQPTRVAMIDTGTATDAAPLGVIPKPMVAPKPLHQQAAAPAVPGKPTPAAPTAPAVAMQPKPAENTQVASIAPQTTPVRTTPPAASAPANVANAAAAEPEDTGATGSFRWPVRGRVISAYGVKANGERNDGINIEAPEGTPIKAAEGGEVIYAGNELKGYGNLVLVKHPSGYVSAYAHAGEILVQRGDTIMRGQTVGKVGATGNVTRPQLHFEIRQGNKPVDPLPYLRG